MLEKQGALEMDENIGVFDEKHTRNHFSPHRDMIKKIEYITKEHRYLSVGRDGIVGIWTVGVKLVRTFNTKAITPGTSWVQDAVFMQEHNKLAIITDDRTCASLSNCLTAP